MTSKPAFPWAPPRQIEETEVPRAEGLAKVTLASGQEPRPAVVTTVLDFGSFPGLALADQAAVNILLQITFNFFSSSWMTSLGSVPEVEGLGYWAGEVL